MRELSPLEKEILNNFLKLEHKEKGDKNFGIPFLKAISEFFVDRKIKLRYNAGKKKIEVKSEGGNSPENSRHGLAFLLALSNLTKYLSSNNRVIILTETIQASGLNKTYKNIESTTDDLDIDLINFVRQEDIEYLFKLFKSTYILSEDLKVYVQKGFKTKEDRKHKDQITAAYVGTAVALLLGLLAIFQQCESTKGNINVSNLRKIIIQDNTDDSILYDTSDTLPLLDILKKK